MSAKFSGTPLARYQLFTLADGSYVIQWDDKQVQELMTGRFREFEYRRDFGHAITDYELKQLKSAGRVEHFNRNYVWVFALPQLARYSVQRDVERQRAYYLSTTLKGDRLSALQALINESALADAVQLAVRHNTVVITGKDGARFSELHKAEQLQAALVAQLPELSAELTVAYDEINQRTFTDAVDRRATAPSLEELIASQTDTTTTAGRVVVLLINKLEERTAFAELLATMELEVLISESPVHALELLEDHHVDLLLMDLQLPQMHGWQLVSKVREIDSLRDVPVLMLADEVNIRMTVAKVDYLMRPVSIARLRHSVWKILSNVQPL